MKFSVYQTSHQGGRANNQDFAGYAFSRHAMLAVLADGMGGHPRGEVAAQLSSQTVAAMFQRKAGGVIEDPVAFLRNAILAGHHRLLRYADEHTLTDTPHTTMVAALVQQGVLHWAHCGDSRLYVVRAGAVLARTTDHSYAALEDALLRAEASSPSASARSRVDRNALYTGLGDPETPLIDSAGPLRLRQGDRLLLCSDGLWGPLTDDHVLAGLGTPGLEHAVETLATDALRAGGPRSDNVTALALEYQGAARIARHRGVSTQALPEGVFASTLQTSLPHVSFDEYRDDAEMQSALENFESGLRPARTRR